MATIQGTAGKVDIVFLLDVTGSMETCLTALKTNLTDFVKSIGDNLKGGVNDPVITLDARYKVCGYRDQSCDGDKWFIDFPFVRNIDEVKTYMNHADMTACGGGDEPESLLDGLYKVGMMPVSGIQEPEDPIKWRRAVRHCILIFSDATFKKATLPEIAGFEVQDIYNKIADKKPVLFGLVPKWDGYDDLTAFPKSKFTYYIEGAAVADLGKDGPKGDAAQRAAVKALEEMSKNNSSFSDFIKLLGADLSEEVTTVSC